MDDLSQRYHNTCIGDFLRRIGEKQARHSLPLLDVIGSPLALTHLDCEALRYGLQSLVSHSDISERLRSQGHTMDISGYTPAGEATSRLSPQLTPRNQRWSAFFRVGKDGLRLDGHEPRMAEQLSSASLTAIKSGVASTHWLPWVIPTEEHMSEMRDLFESPSPKVWPNFQEDFLRLK
jgi:hypothetical protein